MTSRRKKICVLFLALATGILLLVLSILMIEGRTGKPIPLEIEIQNVTNEVTTGWISTKLKLTNRSRISKRFSCGVVARSAGEAWDEPPHSIQVIKPGESKVIQFKTTATQRFRIRVDAWDQTLTRRLMTKLNGILGARKWFAEQYKKEGRKLRSSAESDWVE